MTKRGAVTMKDVAAALGCDEKAAPSRLVALGYVEPCSRCAGSGHHSRCEQYGTMCFKCRGNGRQIVKLTWAIVDAAKARQGAGERRTWQTQSGSGKRRMPLDGSDSRAPTRT